MDLLITDLTEMTGGHYSVAGWCAETSSMVRPLPRRPGWTADVLAAHGVAPGAVVTMSATSFPASGTYPHRTEDTLIHAESIRLVRPPAPGWLDAAPPAHAPSLAEAFQGRLMLTGARTGANLGAHVLRGQKIPSLTAITLPASKLLFVARPHDGALRLRARLTDADACYDLPVVARDLNETFRGAGLPSLNQSLPEGGSVHIRLGLARPILEESEKCFVMVNGVYWERGRAGAVPET
jgi:hypothetical protein